MFEFQFNVVFWTLVSFSVVYYVIGRKIYPLVSKLMKERAEKIATDLALAEAKNKSAEDLHRQVEERLKNINLEEHRIVSEAQEKARQAAELKTREYQTEFVKLRKTKEEDLQKIEQEFYKNFETKVGKILTVACEKIIKCDLTPELQQKILTERIQELKKIKDF